jgi:hypothetical protein
MCYRVCLSERAVSALPPSPGWLCNPWRLPQASHSLRDADLKLVENPRYVGLDSCAALRNSRNPSTLPCRRRLHGFNRF